MSAAAKVGRRIVRAKRRRCSLWTHRGPVYLDGDLNARMEVRGRDEGFSYTARLVFGVCERCGGSTLLYPRGLP